MNLNRRRARLFQCPDLLQNRHDSGLALDAEPAFIGLDAHADDAGSRVLLHGKQLDIVLIPRRRVQVEDLFQLAQGLANEARQALVGLVLYSRRLVA